MPWSDVVISDGGIPPLIVIMALYLHDLDDIEDIMVTVWKRERDKGFSEYLIDDVGSIIKHYAMQNNDYFMSSNVTFNHELSLSAFFLVVFFFVFLHIASVF